MAIDAGGPSTGAGGMVKVAVVPVVLMVTSAAGMVTVAPRAEGDEDSGVAGFEVGAGEGDGGAASGGAGLGGEVVVVGVVGRRRTHRRPVRRRPTVTSPIRHAARVDVRRLHATAIQDVASTVGERHRLEDGRDDRADRRYGAVGHQRFRRNRVTDRDDSAVCVTDTALIAAATVTQTRKSTDVTRRDGRW